MLTLHLDLKWPMYRPEYFQEIVQRAAELGFDSVLLEFENKIRLDWLAQAIHPDAWSEHELASFLALCGENGISVIPKVQLMGHMEWVLQWPWWAHLQENADRHEICPNNPEAVRLVRRLLDDVLRLFPDAPVIHVGGDETRALGTCPRCTATGKSRGRLYLDHYLPLFEQVESAGRRPMIYGDMILAHPEIIDQVPRNVIICDWDYWSGTGGPQRVWGWRRTAAVPDELSVLPEHLQPFCEYLLDGRGGFVDFPYSAFLQDRGFEVMLASAARSAGDNFCFPRTLRHVRNTRAGAVRACELNAAGYLITCWAARFCHFDTCWPAIAAGALAYREPVAGVDDLASKFAREFFGCDWPGAFGDLDLLSPVLPHCHAYHADPYPPDILHKYIRRLYRDSGALPAREASGMHPAASESYVQGLDRLRRQQALVARNREVFTRWLLAAETLVHAAKATPAILELARGGLVDPALKTELLAGVDELERRYREDFARTHCPGSVDTEVDLRFAEQRELLLEREKGVT